MNRNITLPALSIALVAFTITWYILHRIHAEPVHAPTPPVVAVPTETDGNNTPPEGVSTVPVITEETPPPPILTKYIEVTDGCGPYFQGTCLNVRSGPSTTSPVVRQLRTGTVLATSGTETTNDQTWYKVVFDEWLRYPERVTDTWFVSADYVQAFEIESTTLENVGTTSSSSQKEIIIDRSDQKLYAYDGNELFMSESVSTGTELAPTPRGYFSVYRKTPSRYMQGPLPDISEDFYDLPGVPWTLYFTNEGAAIHGAYWHDNFGQQWSHGCVNLPTEKARELYLWADLGTTVLVRD